MLNQSSKRKKQKFITFHSGKKQLLLGIWQLESEKDENRHSYKQECQRILKENKNQPYEAL